MRTWEPLGGAEYVLAIEEVVSRTACLPKQEHCNSAATEQVLFREELEAVYKVSRFSLL